MRKERKQMFNEETKKKLKKSIMKAEWEMTPLYVKIATILDVILSIAVIILSLLQIFKVWDKSLYFILPLMGTIMLLQAIQKWSYYKKDSYLFLATAIFIYIMSIIYIFK